MSEAFIQKLTAIISNPELRPLLSILKGFRNGFVCGAKIRFPHALVMTLLFSNKSAKENAKLILHTTKTHALNLAFFVTIYKTAMLVLSRLNEGKESSSHSLISGFLGGYLIFGKENAVNKQIVLYALARLIMGLGSLPVKRGLIPELNTYPFLSGIVWGLGMWLFCHEPEVYQSSFRATLKYLYVDSNHWTSLRTLFWHNK